MKKKVLLMGASGSGKTSMRSLIFSSTPPSLTSRLGATIDVEQNHVRFLGDLILNLWDCGGQDSFMDSYLTTQRATIFGGVGVLIYVFDVDSVGGAASGAGASGLGILEGKGKDLEYYRDCIDSLKHFSPDAVVFLLIHKMDLVRDLIQKQTVFERKKGELVKVSDGLGLGANVKVFGTSIYDESLYKAWSQIVHTLIPNRLLLSKHLRTLGGACGATEVVLFERTTFLVVATTSSDSPDGAEEDPHALPPTRYERTSELIKAFKHSCIAARLASSSSTQATTFQMELAEYTAVLDEMTRSTYVLVVCHDPVVEPAGIRFNIRMARKKFEELQEQEREGVTGA